MKKLCLLILLMMLLLLSACGSTEEPAPTPKPPIELSAGTFDVACGEISIAAAESDFALLDSFDNLKRVDFSGSTCYDEIMSFIASHPETEVRYSVILPDGRTVSSADTELDMNSADKAALKELESVLPYLPNMRMLHLGDESEGRKLTTADIAALLAAYPELRADYSFTLYGKQVNSRDSEIDLRRVPVDDKGKAVRDALGIMRDCTYLDMDSCGVENEDMADIRDAFPDVKVVWRVSFGENYSVRTDVEKILASKPSVGGMLFDKDVSVLRYCTDVKYLDLGHNVYINDIDFLRYMTKLEVLVIAMEDLDDISALKDLINLEYLEIQTNEDISDLSPLAGLVNLHHLNIAYLPNVHDMTPVYNLTNLERLMIGCVTPIPEEQVEEFRRLVPNCDVDTESLDPTSGTWRYIGYNDEIWAAILHPRYELLCQQFGYPQEDYSFYWNDPLYFAD